MGLVFRQGSRQRRDLWGISSIEQLIPPERLQQSARRPYVTNDSALRHSAVWAAIRLRADLISTLPVDVYRYENGLQVPAGAPRVIAYPGGDAMDAQEWLYSSQVELDRSGNSIGLIRDRDRDGYPTRIDLQPTSICSVLVSDGELTGYRIAGKKYGVDEVWHEKQYTVSGLHVGLSPVAYAAFQLGEYQSVLDFALTWFGENAVPRVMLKNTSKKLTPKESVLAQESFRASQNAGEPFITGNDWELSFLSAQQNASQWIDVRKFSIPEIARFFNVPADMIDGNIGGSSDTYANIVQRNLQFLIMNLGPSIIRREKALGKLIPGPRFVKFNTDALLRMDPHTRSEMLQTQLRSHQITPTEARAIENRPPFTPEQEAESLKFFPPRQATVNG